MEQIKFFCSNRIGSYLWLLIQKRTFIDIYETTPSLRAPIKVRANRQTTQIKWTMGNLKQITYRRIIQSKDEVSNIFKIYDEIWYTNHSLHLAKLQDFVQNWQSCISSVICYYIGKTQICFYGCFGSLKWS